MKQRKKNKFFTFILSFMPGAAEMYMGFLKQGLSMMTLFLIVVYVGIVWAQEIGFFASILIWFYSFFHARNIVACEEEDFQNLQDDYIWTSFIDERNIQITNPTLRKWGAGILIVFGVIMLWQNFSRMIYCLIPDSLWDVLAPIVDQVPKIVIAILIIYIGVRMIMGKKEELDGDNK